MLRTGLSGLLAGCRSQGSKDGDQVRKQSRNGRGVRKRRCRGITISKERRQETPKAPARS